MTREEYEERFKAIESQVTIGGCSVNAGLAMAAILGQEYQASLYAKDFVDYKKSVEDILGVVFFSCEDLPYGVRSAIKKLTGWKY